LDCNSRYLARTSEQTEDFLCCSCSDLECLNQWDSYSFL
jgi:hypothetical protein